MNQKALSLHIFSFSCHIKLFLELTFSFRAEWLGHSNQNCSQKQLHPQRILDAQSYTRNILCKNYLAKATELNIVISWDYTEETNWDQWNLKNSHDSEKYYQWSERCCDNKMDCLAQYKRECLIQRSMRFGERNTLLSRSSKSWIRSPQPEFLTKSAILILCLSIQW